MKCPCCGHEMEMDGHRKIDLMMCYECGYIEGRRVEPVLRHRKTNFERLHELDLHDTVELLSQGLHLDEQQLTHLLESAVA